MHSMEYNLLSFAPTDRADPDAEKMCGADRTRLLVKKKCWLVSTSNNIMFLLERF